MNNTMTGTSKDVGHSNSGSLKRPVMLTNGLHPLHEAIAEQLDAVIVPAEKGGVKDRLLSAATSKYDGPVILEGGLPLLEGAFLKLLHRVNGPVILLAADETQQNIFQSLEYYSKAETLAHKWAHKHIDGAIAVHSSIENWLDELIDGPTAVAETFILPGKYDRLKELEPTLDGSRILTVGESRTGNGHDLLAEAHRAVRDLGFDVETHFVGKGTEGLGVPAKDVYGHGYVPIEELYQHFEKADLFVMPARANANPVSVLEAQRAGLPILATTTTGSASRVDGIRWQLARTPDSYDIAQGIAWYLQQSVEDRKEIARKFEEKSLKYEPNQGITRFQKAYREVVSKA